MSDSKFQFIGFNIVRSLIERKDITPSKKLTVIFNPKGIINKKDSNFQLHLDVKIEDEKKVINIEIKAIANYYFEKEIDLEKMNNFFFLNAPALVFPYLRAYISTLTNLSGFETLTLPTLNMTGLGEDLKKNTTEV